MKSGPGAVGVDEDQVVSGEGSVVDMDGVSGLENGDRGHVQIVGQIEQDADGLDLFVGDGNGFFVPKDAIEDGIVLQNSDAASFIHQGEDIAGHSGFLDLFPAVAPAHLGLDQRAEYGEAGFLQALLDLALMAGFHIIGSPDLLAGMRWLSHDV